MRRLVTQALFMLLIASPSAGEAQDQAASAEGQAPSLSKLALLPVGHELAVQAKPVQQPPRPLPRPRRRGSMVGYIEDPIIESKIRLRYDFAFENTTPDRAEFFYAKCGCYQGLPANNEAFDPDAPGPQPGIASDVDFRTLFVSGEYALSPRFSAIGQLPFRWLQPQAFVPGTGSFPNQSGVEDIRIGAKAGIVATDVQSVTGQVRLFLPTGDSSKGLGTDHSSLEPALLYYQRVNDVVAVESQLGAWLPLDGAAPVPTAADGTFAGDILFYGIGSSFAVSRSDRLLFAPVVELVGWRVLNGNQTAAVGDAGGINVVNLKFGARTVFERGSIYVGYGFALTDETWYENILRMEYRVEF
jgi:hypothetical protein